MRGLPQLILSGFFLLVVFYGCREKEVFPDQLDEKSSVSDLTEISATISTDIFTELPGDVEDYGHAWAEGERVPDLNSSHTSLKKGSIPDPFSFESNITDLKRGTNYTARPYVKLKDRVIYGGSLTFTTELGPDALEERSTVTDVTDVTATVSTEVLTTKLYDIRDFGHVWSEKGTLPDLDGPHSSLFKESPPTPFVFESFITELKEETEYVVRAYVKLADRVIYGNPLSFKTGKVNIERLVTILNDSLKDRDFGYSFVVIKDGKTLGSGQGGWAARDIEPQGPLPVTLDSKMQIASMTKTLVAAAFFRLAREKGLSTTSKIIGFLPEYWKKGPHIDRITFGDLLKHQSGFMGLNDNCVNGSYAENVWYGLASMIEKGVDERYIGSYCYQNANFGLFRVLIPAILGYEFKEEATDMLETAGIFEEYLRTTIVGSINNPPNYLLGNDALQPTYGYDVPYSGSAGFNPGDFLQQAGGYGVYLSAKEAAALYTALFDENDTQLLSQAQKDSILIQGFGSFSAITPQGRFSYHDGWWYLGAPSGKPKGFRSIWMKGPDNVVVVLFTNGLRNGDGLFPLRSNSYQDITSFLLWAFSRTAGDGSRARMEDVDFHRYLEHPEPH